MYPMAASFRRGILHGRLPHGTSRRRLEAVYSKAIGQRKVVGKGNAEKLGHQVVCLSPAMWRRARCYTGITKDVTRRTQQHNAETASRYTRSRLPVALVYQES